MSKSNGKIQDIGQLRDFALETIQRLANGEIDTAQAGVTGKLCESVISTIKAQLEYSRMIDEQPQIAFMSNANRHQLIEGNTSSAALPDHSKRK